METTPDSPRLRLADRLVLHGAPLDFRELCRRAVPEATRYVVLDLDRTVHLGRNMGELLGWEVCAWHAYGEDHLGEVEWRRPRGRFFLDRGRPLAALRYLGIGARMWAVPGLFYLLFGKLPGRSGLLRRWAFRRFGSDPVAAVQRVPQTALLHHLAGIPARDLRVLARRVWDRHAGDQTIEAADLVWLRAHAPGVRIVIASASPRPTVEVAAEALGADDVLCTTVEERDGWYSAPYRLQPSLSRPRRLSGPRDTRINSSHAKVEALWARYPDLADRSVVSVGITDTGYGEDHCWMNHFTRVVDVNSATPFPPLVPSSSPLQEIHSAGLLTRDEQARRAAGAPRWADARRPARPAEDHVFTARELAEGLGPVVAEAERLARSLDERSRGLEVARRRIGAAFADGLERIDALVRAFNDAPEPERPAVLEQLRRELGRDRTLERELARIERPVSEVACALTGLLAEARGALGERGARAA